MARQPLSSELLRRVEETLNLRDERTFLREWRRIGLTWWRSAQPPPLGPPRARKRPGPKLPDALALRVFLACDTVLEPYHGQSSWHRLTADRIVKAVHQYMKQDQQHVPKTAGAIRPFVLWYLQIIMAHRDRPPRLNYKVGVQFDADGRPRFPNSGGLRMHFTDTEWDSLSETQRQREREKWRRRDEKQAQQFAQKHLRAAPPVLPKYYARYRESLQEATMYFLGYPRDSVLKKWEEAHPRPKGTPGIGK